MELPVLAVIVPCYNEEECILDTSNRLVFILETLEHEKEISNNSFIFFVDDGSNDDSWVKIQTLAHLKPGKIKGVKFSKNFGHQKAILAGLLESSKYNADCFISIDADLQQDEFKIKEFVQKYKQGAQIVLGIRNNRNTDSFFKRITALCFYKLMSIIAGKNKIILNSADYRLVSSKVVETLKNFPETSLFLRGVFNNIGFKKDYVYYDVKPRKFGKTKFTFIKMVSLAISGITSFSTMPLRIVSFTGLIMSIVSFFAGLSILWEKVVHNTTIPEWATIVTAIGLIGGIQILCIGIIGEYIGQIFNEAKSRPRYIIEEQIK